MTDEIKCYKEAGRIAAQALQYAAALAKEGALVLDIAEKTEARIRELGGKPAFPMNVSINDVAAHYTPVAGDRMVIGKNDYVKLDVGAHVNGFIGDTAVTVRPAGEDDLIRCSKKMLDAALPLFVPGTRISDIGAAIEDVAKGMGFKPVANLTGHSLSQYDLHAGHVIPNVRNGAGKRLEEGEAYAVEPFATTGAGMVKDSEPTLIFRCIADKPSRLPEARKIMELAKKEYSMLPFAKRWLKMPGVRMEAALKQLVSAGALHPYMVLKEVSGAPVSQAEHTVLVDEKPIVTTRIH
ncbi:MAG: type II methionyl aminopeptidase [Candidatus Aenigmatarchaeota archaeon]